MFYLVDPRLQAIKTKEKEGRGGGRSDGEREKKMNKNGEVGNGGQWVAGERRKKGWGRFLRVGIFLSFPRPYFF